MYTSTCKLIIYSFLNLIFFGLFKKNVERNQNKFTLALIDGMKNKEKDAKFLADLVINRLKIKVNNIKYHSELCEFLKNCNILTPDIEKTLLVKDSVEKNKDLYYKLEDYFKNKTVAIVGNSNFEVGKSSGEEIDSHDIVVRFNSYPAYEEYFEDYGKKCNIWVRGIGRPGEIYDRNLENFDFVLISFEILKHLNIEHIYNWCINSSNHILGKIFNMPLKYWDIAKEKYNNTYPTTGFIFILLAMEFAGIENIDFYGFSFLDDCGKEDSSHYYDNNCTLSNKGGHTIDVEREVLRKIFKENVAKRTNKAPAFSNVTNINKELRERERESK